MYFACRLSTVGSKLHQYHSYSQVWENLHQPHSTQGSHSPLRQHDAQSMEHAILYQDNDGCSGHTDVEKSCRRKRLPMSDCFSSTPDDKQSLLHSAMKELTYYCYYIIQSACNSYRFMWSIHRLAFPRLFLGVGSGSEANNNTIMLAHLCASRTSECLQLGWEDQQRRQPEVEISCPHHGSHSAQLTEARDHHSAVDIKERSPCKLLRSIVRNQVFLCT